MFKRKLTKNYANLEILVPYLNNSSEEAIFENNKTKKDMKQWHFKMKKLMLKNT